MANESEYLELGKCLEMVIDHRGKTPKKLGADWVERGVPTISAKNVNGGRLVAKDAIRHVSHDVYRRWMKDDVKRGDCFLVSEGATLGECMLWDEDYPVVLGQRIFCLRANPAVLYPRYLYAYMTSADFQSEIIARATGTSVDGLRQTEVLKMKIKNLPMEQQKTIGDTLYFLNAKIELNRRMNETLEAMARAIFQSWFVDFDPVRAKRDGVAPVGLSPDIAALFPDSFEDSELGKIPMGWKVKPVGEVVECVGGGTPSTTEPKFWEGGTHHWTTPKDFSSLQSPVLLDTDRKITDAGIAKISSGLLPAGTLLLSSRAPVGYLAIAAIPVAINQGFIAIKCNERASNVFMLNWCQSNMAEIESRATGTTFAEISKQNFRPILVVLPTKELMAAFTVKVMSLYEKITTNVRQSALLATIRDTLLPKLLSGEIRMSEVKQIVKESQ